MKFISVMGYTIGMSFNVQHSYIHLFSTHNSMHRSSSGSTKKKTWFLPLIILELQFLSYVRSPIQPYYGQTGLRPVKHITNSETNEERFKYTFYPKPVLLFPHVSIFTLHLPPTNPLDNLKKTKDWQKHFLLLSTVPLGNSKRCVKI